VIGAWFVHATSAFGIQALLLTAIRALSVVADRADVPEQATR
jgi:hypothetical protein